MGTIAPNTLPTPEERIKTREAGRVTGIHPRRLQQKAERGDFDGVEIKLIDGQHRKVNIVVKVDGEYLWHRVWLLAWIETLAEEQCQTRKALAGPRPRPIRNGASVSGTARPSGGAFASKGSSGGGRYTRAMSNLLARGLPRTSRG